MSNKSIKRHNQCLVLNADYSPVGIIDWKRAILYTLKHSSVNVEIIEYHEDDYIVGVNDNYLIPAIIRVKTYLNLNNYLVHFSRKNLFIRDNFTCQYCGNKNHINNLTYDHVIPKSKWRDKTKSPTNWNNIVTACTKCNRKKGSRTPSQANMPLINKPYSPSRNKKYLHVSYHLATIKNNMPEKWKLYIR